MDKEVITSCREVVGLSADPAPFQEAVADVGFPADLAPADEPLDGLAAAIRASRRGHPSRSRAANWSRTGTSPRRASRGCTNSNGGLST